MMIDERVAELVVRLPLRILEGDALEVEQRIKAAMLLVARDQRHACVQALIDVYGTARKGGVVTGDAAYQAVMNAQIT